MSNCLIAQSGGPTSVINASLSGVISSSIENPNIHTVYGSINGIQGILNHNLINLTSVFADSKDKLEILKTTPSMFLGSCRYKLPEASEDETEYKLIFDILEHKKIKYFFYIGGNDSMDTVLKLSKYAKNNNKDLTVIGIPKTIDNDLFGTDHTPGFGSAAKFVATTLLEISYDTYIYDIPSVTIVEIMGRNAGWLTAAAALARTEHNSSPDLIYLPEVPFSIYDFLNSLKQIQKTKKNIIVAVSEGIKDKDRNYISSCENSLDDCFGHAKLSGTGKTLEHIVSRSLGCKVRSIELNVLQRSAMHIASLQDINEAFLVGAKAVEYAVKGITGKMVTLIRTNNEPYTYIIDYVDIEKVANKEKLIPIKWIAENNGDVSEQLIEYISPLIYGEPNIRYKQGLPVYLDINHLINK
ncbi:pyrophosphate--fructose 6-phosphate 1-phosphotransferase [Vallitalea longa]|uniref:Pyrophosphate--fructose 6-phosphate 1-phosphotransferase n=1 Tax=Vallitalea longa TaxID=2936439 RepID=A0A9W5YE99_9FIRM|nr:6-phosphofructokinase [Vallitalea longa]GKX31071.1 pyrophosphate--fructose 6-phosphate 1-phosphotransferase [Vallitalea longa]